MKVTIKSKEKRELIAVIGCSNKGFFIRKENPYHSAYIDNEGLVEKYQESHKPLEELLNVDGRKPVYKGDIVTIKF